MDVFLMIRRKKWTMFTDAKENTTVLELKKMIEGITKVLPDDQQLYNYNNELMDEKKNLQDNGYTSATARAQAPAQIGLACRQNDGEFEPLEITPYSTPPELPDVMKSQDQAHVSNASGENPA